MAVARPICIIAANSARRDMVLPQMILTDARSGATALRPLAPNTGCGVNASVGRAVDAWILFRPLRSANLDDRLFRPVAKNRSRLQADLVQHRQQSDGRIRRNARRAVSCSPSYGPEAA